jgi:5-methyltetrahydrofolate--homocysteine methyltransferase
MTKQEFLKLNEQKIVILDGATGSNLQKAGMDSKVCPELWILEHKEVLIQLQYDFLMAGSDILYAPTFTSNRIKLAEYKVEDRIQEINHSLIQLSKEAVSRFRVQSDRPVYIAGDLTMTGEQLEPYGKMKFEDLINIYKEQIKYIVEEGVDLLVVETMLSLQECRAALIAAKEVCDLPVMITLTFNEDGRTLFGTDPKTALIVLQSLGADAVGVNCSTGPKKMCEVLEKMKPYAKVPLIAKPNAGLPQLIDGKTVFSLEAEEFATECEHFAKLGIQLIGGCCGSTAEHIRKVADMAKAYKPSKVVNPKFRALTTERSTVEIDINGRFMVVGERINPTGKKALQAQLKENCFDIVCEMATDQVEAGADILDINMGMNGIDECEMMLKVIKEVTQLVDVPLCIDSSHIHVIEAALRAYPGRALINSISLEKEKFERLLPIAKKYGAMFILLPLSDAGLPKDIEEKKQIIHTIYEEALKLGMEKEDIIVDGLVNTVGANKLASIQTIETIRYCKEELELATIVGLSNISFGLPERQFVNSTFLAFAIQAGLTMAIANPAQDLLMNTAFAADLLRNKEEADLRYINRVTARPTTISVASNAPVVTDEKTGKEVEKDKTTQGSQIYEAVIKGNKRVILGLTEDVLSQGYSASGILDEMLIPAINEVGRLFDQGKYFLPQLIASAETMKTAIDRLEPLLQENNQGKKAGVIVIATVAGDIHDIGKNLVALMLKNYGFEIIDLGKDVSADTIIQSAKQHDADIIALSALMTTTMLEMRKVVESRNQEKLRAKVIIGGAVITQSYCDEIHADGYSKDAQEAVGLVKRLLGQ